MSKGVRDRNCRCRWESCTLLLRIDRPQALLRKAAEQGPAPVLRQGFRNSSRAHSEAQNFTLWNTATPP